MHWLFWWRPPCLLQPVIVNLTTNDTAIKGVLWRTRGAWLTIRRAELLVGAASPRPIDGEVVVHREQVHFIQVLPL
jgi:hypothetical protein